jgi:predicted outer membrane protein
MSAALRTKIGVCAAGLSYLMAVGYAQAQQQQTAELTKPTQYADQNTGQPVADQQYGGQLIAQGQRNTTYFRGPEAAGSSDRGANASVDNYLANCLLIKNRGEIEINQFAENRAQKDDVKKFARQMVEDHSQLGQKLERLVSTNHNANRNAALNQLIAIDRQIAEKCGQMTRAKLEEAPEGEFDKCFVGSQIGAHMQMLAGLEVIAAQSPSELQQIAQDAKATVKQHLDHAEKLMKELDSADTRQARN